MFDYYTTTTFEGGEDRGRRDDLRRFGGKYVWYPLRGNQRMYKYVATLPKEVESKEIWEAR